MKFRTIIEIRGRFARLRMADGNRPAIVEGRVYFPSQRYARTRFVGRVDVVTFAAFGGNVREIMWDGFGRWRGRRLELEPRPLLFDDSSAWQFTDEHQKQFYAQDLQGPNGFSESMKSRKIVWGGSRAAIPDQKSH